MTTTNDTRSEFPKTLYAVLVCRDEDSAVLRTIDASPDLGSLQGKDRKPLGPSRYYTIVPRELPASIRTLGRKFGDRAKFSHDPDGQPGCWIDGKPHRLDVEITRHWTGEITEEILGWTWNRREAEYIEALIAYRKSRPTG